MSARGQVYVAMVRAINVAGRPLLMADLRALIEALPAEEVSTYVQSGNVVFRSAAPNAGAVAGAASARISKHLGAKVTVVVRGADDLARVVAHNPLASAGRDETKLHVTFLASDPGRDRAAALGGTAPGAGNDLFKVDAREVYLFCPDGYGRTKLNNAFFERKLGVAATTRNWRTVTRLDNMARALGSDR
jgi:uncharacterized protein (DUF1697 family)